MAVSPVAIDPEHLADFCRRHHVARLSLLLVLRDDFTPESDVDMLVEFETGRTPGLEFFAMGDELSRIVGRRVDLNTPEFLSLYFRDEVLAERARSMSHPETDTLLFQHMLDAARAALSFTSGRTRDDLSADLMLQFALVLPWKSLAKRRYEFPSRPGPPTPRSRGPPRGRTWRSARSAGR